MKDTARVRSHVRRHRVPGLRGRRRSRPSPVTPACSVWNGLTDERHPTQMLADILTMLDHAACPIDEVSYCYLGDARNNTADSLLVTGALLGADVRLAAPKTLWPSSEVLDTAERLAAGSGARVMVTDDLHKAVAGADFLYTDVWLSMGEPADEWGERINELLGYQVNADVLEATGNPEVKFMHCLPALHNRETEVGEQIFEKYRLTGSGGDRGRVRVASLHRLRPSREPPAHDQGSHGRHPGRLRCESSSPLAATPCSSGMSAPMPSCSSATWRRQLQP